MVEQYLNNRFLVLYITPLLLGLLTVFSFQPFNFSILNFFILPLFFYFIVFIKKKSRSTYRKKPYRKNLFIFGTIFGFSFFLSNIHWITNSLTFDENFKILIPFGLILIPLFLSLFFSLVTIIVGPLLSLNLPSIIFFSASLAVSDFIRAKILTGFPWNLWVYSFSSLTEVIQVLNIIGLFAFNLLSITIFLLPAVLFLKLDFVKKILILLLLPILFFLSYIYGSHSINLNQKKLKDVEEKFNLKVISPNFDLIYGLDNEEIEIRLKKLIKYSEPEKNLKTLFVWPEGVFSGYSFDEIIKLKSIFKENFSKNHFILFGINKINEKEKGIYNSLIITNYQLEILQEYNKQKLVPFGEFLPMENFLRKFGFKKITEGHGSFLKGQKQNNLIIENLNILPLICYEIIFTELIQSSKNKTNLIVNISEDGWFGQSIGPHQHFAKSIFRAVENNTFLVRSANKGISAIINNKGEILKKLTSFEAGNIQIEIPLIKNKNKNKNDLIFFALLITYIFVFKLYTKNNDK